eukprot:2658387-Alexandrium_andersonii.AAC.1
MELPLEYPAPHGLTQGVWLALRLLSEQVGAFCLRTPSATPAGRTLAGAATPSHGPSPATTHYFHSMWCCGAVSYTHLRAHETSAHL